MAGRGTDILLGGNPEFLARRAMRQKGYADEVIEDAMGHNENVPEEVLAARVEYRALFEQYKKETDAQHDRVVAVGGLHIIGTERHESRRIDNQLRGRSGRQGDPGSSQFFLSLQDDLLRLFGSERISGMIDKLGLEEDQPIEAKMLTGQIESAQKRIEGRNFEIRKNVLQYDDVMNQQREVIYGQRRQVLMGEDMRKTVMSMVKQLIDDAVDMHTGNGDAYVDWDLAGLSEYLDKLCVRPGVIDAHMEEIKNFDKQALKDLLFEDAQAFYQEREALLGEHGIDMREVERVILLSAVDRRWMDHIDAMDQLRDGIGLRAYGHKDPVVEYKFEGYEMFDEMVRLIREDTLRRLYQARVERAPERRQVAKPVEAKTAGTGDGPRQPQKADKKVGRNDPCPCGSGKKYKHCCGKEA